MNPFPDPATLSKRASTVVLVVILMAAVSGYFMGLHQTTRDDRRSSEPVPGSSPLVQGAQASTAPRVVGYHELATANLKPNAAWRSSLATLVSAAPRPLPTRTAAEAAIDRTLAVEKRRSRRAYDGAPPVIPHPVDPTSPASCRACHETGLVIRDLIAPRMSHGDLGSCTQCHVPAGGTGIPMLAETAALPPFAENAFNGVRSSGAGSRAWPGAPPTIPHTVQMRENCASCHGLTGLPGLRTTHPERTLCVQCHVPESGAGGLPWRLEPGDQQALLQPLSRLLP